MPRIKKREYFEKDDYHLEGSLKDLFFGLLEFLAPFKRKFIFSIFLIFLSSFFAMSSARLIGLLVDEGLLKKNWGDFFGGISFFWKKKFWKNFGIIYCGQITSLNGYYGCICIYFWKPGSITFLGTMSGYLHAENRKHLRTGYREMLKNGKKYSFKWLLWIFFFENPAPSLFRNHMRLPSCQISEKSNQWIQRKVSN